MSFNGIVVSAPVRLVACLAVALLCFGCGDMELDQDSGHAATTGYGSSSPFSLHTRNIVVPRIASGEVTLHSGYTYDLWTSR